jgi:kynurenine formamidase
LSEAAGEWLVEQGASGFGIDTQALDHPCASYMAAHGPLRVHYPVSSRFIMGSLLAIRCDNVDLRWLHGQRGSQA